VRVWRIPFSTNCERVALAAGWAGVELDWVDVDVLDRSVVEELSGQKRVPVAEIDGAIVAGSLAICAHVAPGLWPAGERERAEMDVFLEWFDRVWLHPIGVLWLEPDERKKARAAVRAAASVDRIEALLAGGDFLFGELSIADVAAYPFLRYATDRNPADDYAIHDEMRRVLSVDGRPRVSGWLERMAALPRA
jgi:glutathione S-transferase